MIAAVFTGFWRAICFISQGAYWGFIGVHGCFKEWKCFSRLKGNLYDMRAFQRTLHDV